MKVLLTHGYFLMEDPNEQKIMKPYPPLGLLYISAYLNKKKINNEVFDTTFSTRQLLKEYILKTSPDYLAVYVNLMTKLYVLELIGFVKSKAELLKTKIILGGPEVSYETEQQAIVDSADFVLTGAADLSFYHLCKDILNKTEPENKILKSKPVELKDIELPYQYYSDKDLKHRLLYVEASRGCPFKCEFCLSSLDKASNPFELDLFLEQMEILYQRGARSFKFIDRTFNLNIDTTLQIMQFFLDRLSEDLFLHFEVVPDHLPRKLKELLTQFPEGSLQFEVGIQTFKPEVQENISRKQNNRRSKENLLWLRENTKAHIHADLIFGLPGETLDTFRYSFNELYHCRPHEIQLGILKRLKGTPINRHTEAFDLRFSPLPPFNLLSNDRVDFATMQRMNRFARYWDMIGNSGHFKHSLVHMLSENPFDDFMAIADWLFNKTGQTHKINLKRLYELVAQSIEALFPEKHQLVVAKIELDYPALKLKSHFNRLQLSAAQQSEPTKKNKFAQRQLRRRSS